MRNTLGIKLLIFNLLHKDVFQATALADVYEILLRLHYHYKCSPGKKYVNLWNL